MDLPGAHVRSSGNGPGGHALPTEPRAGVQPEPATVPHPQLQEDLPRPGGRPGPSQLRRCLQDCAGGLGRFLRGEVERGPSFAFISSAQVCAHQGLTALPQQTGHTGPKCDFPGLCGHTGSGAVPPAAAVGQVQGCFPCALVVVGSRGRRGSQLLSGGHPGGRRVAASGTVEAGRSWHQDSAFPGSTCHREEPGPAGLSWGIIA